MNSEQYVMPNVMDPISIEILTNPKFKYSTLTWDDMVTMANFWILRFANPTKSTWAWILLLSAHRPALFDRLAVAFATGNKDFDTYFKHNFELRGRLKDLSNTQVVPIINFNEEAARQQHGNWAVKTPNLF